MKSENNIPVTALHELFENSFESSTKPKQIVLTPLTR